MDEWYCVSYNYRDKYGDYQQDSNEFPSIEAAAKWAAGIIGVGDGARVRHFRLTRVIADESVEMRAFLDETAEISGRVIHLKDKIRRLEERMVDISRIQESEYTFMRWAANGLLPEVKMEHEARIKALSEEYLALNSELSELRNDLNVLWRQR